MARSWMSPCRQWIAASSSIPGVSRKGVKVDIVRNDGDFAEDSSSDEEQEVLVLQIEPEAITEVAPVVVEQQVGQSDNKTEYYDLPRQPPLERIIDVDMSQVPNEDLIYKPDYVIVTWFGQIFDIAM